MIEPGFINLVDTIMWVVVVLVSLFVMDQIIMSLMGDK